MRYGCDTFHENASVVNFTSVVENDDVNEGDNDDTKEEDDQV